MKTAQILTKELFDHIGKYRSALMGISMIMVFLLHARSEKLGFMPTGFWGMVCQNGNLGVDIFLFLSAFGLCFSLKNFNYGGMSEGWAESCLPDGRQLISEH